MGKVPEQDVYPADAQERLRADTAARVAEIWRRVLERPALGEDDDFFLHGGTHFLAPVLIDAVNLEFGEEIALKLTVRDLAEARTIDKMTDHVYFERARNAIRTAVRSEARTHSETLSGVRSGIEIGRSTVVPLRNLQGSRAPLFLVHGVGGNVLGFYGLAKCMEDDRPVYGIQAQALLPDEPAVLRLEQMAARYVQDIRAVAPSGPYHLLGFSYGGLVAFEIARQLWARGAEVGLVGMLDTRQPEWMRGVPMHGPIYRRALGRLRTIYLHTRGRKGRLRYLCQRVNERVLRASYRAQASVGLGAVESAVRNVREINLVAGIQYKVRPYAGVVTLFRAESDPNERALPEDLNWRRFAQGGLAIRHLTGDHGRILHQPGLGALGLELKELLGSGAEEKRVHLAADAERVSIEI